MSDFVYNKNKISSVKRVRILENRDLKKGLRLNRNERVDNYPIGIYKKIFANVNDYDLGKYTLIKVKFINYYLFFKIK